jgi:hypothetical protein
MSAVNRIYHALVVEMAKGGAARDRAIAKASEGRTVEAAQALDLRPAYPHPVASSRARTQAYAAELRTKTGIPGPREVRG